MFFQKTKIEEFLQDTHGVEKHLFREIYAEIDKHFPHFKATNNKINSTLQVEYKTLQNALLRLTDANVIKAKVSNQEVHYLPKTYSEPHTYLGATQESEALLAPSTQRILLFNKDVPVTASMKHDTTETRQAIDAEIKQFKKHLENTYEHVEINTAYQLRRPNWESTEHKEVVENLTFLERAELIFPDSERKLAEIVPAARNHSSEQKWKVSIFNPLYNSGETLATRIDQHNKYAEIQNAMNIEAINQKMYLLQ